LGRSDDQAYWVSRDTFFRLFDQNDFACRQRLDVLPRYRSDWFWRRDGSLLFHLPTVQFAGRPADGHTEFINGRHRTAVLIQYLQRLPLALVMPFRMHEEGLSEITAHRLRMDQPLELPDLPIDDAPCGGR
jgi:hypothetical protein